MIPDLRPPKQYAHPLPKSVIYVYLFVACLVLWAGLNVVHEWRETSRIHGDIVAKKQEIVSARARTTSFESKVNGLESSRTVRSSADRWKEGSSRVAALQAAAIVVVAEAQAALIEQAKKTPLKQPKPTMTRGRSTSIVAIVPSVQLRSLAVVMTGDPEKAETGIVELRMELAHNGDSRQLITALSAAFSPMKPEGLNFKNFRPEDRGGIVVLTTTWKKATAQ